MISLGIEGTAHTLGIGIVRDGDILADVKKTYSPEEGGIHPREAARYMADNFSKAVKEALDIAKINKKDIDIIAFSQGPGLGPCLSNVAVGARALTISLNCPLIGVNHCVAHIEIGNLLARKEHPDWTQPLVIYVSGGNTQILMFKDGRYRVFGETLDIGLGNMLDKFGRLTGIQHPAGPKIEQLAANGKEFIELPYVVKGNDLSFSGILTDALRKSEKAPLEDVCYSLQETCFAMLVEASERALCHLKSDSVLLTGGVANNKRLQEMCSQMAADNGVPFSVPRGYCGDNGVMIAWTGLLMYKHGWKQDIEQTAVDQNYRTDQVEISWAKSSIRSSSNLGDKWKGAEALVERSNCSVKKVRNKKAYRIPILDESIRKARTSREPKLIKRAKEAGVNVPRVLSIDKKENTIELEFIDGATLSSVIESKKDANIGRPIGESVAKLHKANIIHGDLTTSNMLYLNGKIFLIDFGLGFVSPRTEDKATDLLLLKKAFNANHSSISEALWSLFLEGYTTRETQDTIATLKKAELRGRYL